MHKRPVLFILNKDNATWSIVVGQLLPLMVSSAMMATIVPDVLIVGGSSSSGFNDKIYKASINQGNDKSYANAEVMELVNNSIS